MKSLRCTLYIFIVCLILVFSLNIEGILHITSNIKAQATPIEIYSEVSNTPQSLTEEQKSYILKRRNMYPKEVFLTFDDGPSSNNTLDILNTLKKNNIKATFFVIGRKVQQYPDIVKKLNDAGMCILPHSYSHSYSIYKNTSSYFQDLEACNLAIEKVIGRKNPMYTRLPGGSDNCISNKIQMQKIRSDLKEKYIYYIDWNVSSADAADIVVPMERIEENVINQCSAKKLAVILMHDSTPKITSAKALPYIVKFLKNKGFEFKTFDEITIEEERVMIKQRIINR